MHDSGIIPMYIVHELNLKQDPDVWEEPHEFRPERFSISRRHKTFSKVPWKLWGRRTLGQERAVCSFWIWSARLHGRGPCQGHPPHILCHSHQADQVIEKKDTLYSNLWFLWRFEKPEGHLEPDPKEYTDGFTIIPKPFYVNIKPVHRK